MTDFQREKRKVVTVAIIQALGVVPILLQNILLKNWLIVTVFSVYCLLCALNYGYYVWRKKYNLWAYIMMTVTALDFGFYVWNGGVQGAGIFWSLSLPFLAMYLLGHTNGGRFSLVYFSVLLLLSISSLLTGFVMPYTPQVLIVFFLVSFINVYLLFTIEKSRHEMREEVDRINRLFNHVADLLFIGQKDGSLTSVSPSCSTVLGWTREELMGKVFVDFIHPLDKAVTITFNEQLLNVGHLENLDNRFLCKDGSYRWLSWRATLDREQNLVYAVARDMTEEKRTKSRLQASEEAFRTLSEQSNAGIYISQRGHFVNFNKGLLDLLGYSEEELHVLEVSQFVHPNDWESVLERVKRREGGEQGLMRSDFRILTKQGQTKWVNLVTDLITHEGSPAVVGTMHDITEAKQREEALRFRSELQRLMADVSTEFITSGPDTLTEKMDGLLERFCTFLDFDRAFLYTLNDDVNQLVDVFQWHKVGIDPFVSIFHDLDTEQLDSISAFFKSFDQVYVPNVLTAKEDLGWVTEKARRHQFQSILLLPLVRNKQTMGVLGFEAVTHPTVVDEEIIGLLKMLTHVLTEVLLKNELDLSLKTAASEMDALNQTKDKLFSIIAHDLRSPFNTIISFTELMADKTQPMTLEAIQGYAGMLNQVALVSLELLENLLDWSRLQRGMLKPERNHVLVDEFIKVAIASYMERATARKQWVNIQVEPGLKVAIDKRMMETVLRNLFTNAIKFTPDGGVITLQALQTVDKQLRIAVSDTGIGIPEKLLPLLFTVEESKNRAGLGGERSSGLGLMLCKEFVELHGGRLWVETAEFKGSTFYVEVPMMD